MRLRLIKQAFDDPEYLFELKHDGFRGLVYLQDGESSLVSRNLKNLRFDSLKKSLAELPVKNAILDGEIICIPMLLTCYGSMMTICGGCR